MSRGAHSDSKYSEKPHKYTVEECNDLKEKGNSCMSQGKYAEAVIHYTFAMENFPHSEMHFLYSNRSMALLKADQYYFALQDAEKAIELAPTWPKGYLRKGEVQYQAGLFADAIKSYNQARVRDAADKSIVDCVKKANRQLIKTNKDIARRPWMFTASSFLIGALLVTGDHFITQFPILQYMLLKLILLILFGCAGYMISRIYQYTLDKQANSLLEEPPDFLGNPKSTLESQSSTEENTVSGSSQKVHKSSRHRHRRGRS